MEKKKRLSIFPFGGEVDEDEEFASYAVVILLIAAVLTAIIPWAKFFYKFTTF